jgi:membrane associated rhomboid family serine protease
LFLWIFGNNVEDRLGKVRYIVFYLMAGVVATIAHVMVNASSPETLVGASGAIAGVMGAYLVWFPRVKITTAIFFVIFVRLRAWVLLLAWFVLQFFTNASSNVAWVAHVAGFVFGALVGLLFRGEVHDQQPPVLEPASWPPPPPPSPWA